MSEEKRLIIKFLQIPYGDAIRINYKGNDDNWHNIFIDAGFVNTYLRTLKQEVIDIKSKDQRIELFVITHTDQDHISGIKSFIKEFGDENLVDQYWFNAENSDFELEQVSDKISYWDGIKLRNYLNSTGLLKDKIHSSLPSFDFYGAKILILTPLLEDLGKFEEEWKTQESILKAKGKSFEIISREKLAAKENDYEASIEDLVKNSFDEDDSLENKISISFLFEYLGNKFLFLADSHPSSVIDSLKKLGFSKEKKLTIDYVKLSHHGSKSNTSIELLDYIQCENFIITANGENKHMLPNKETIARILANPSRVMSEPKKVNLIFCFESKVIESILKKEDEDKYNFNRIYPIEGDNGYTIELY
ncbi:MAG: hypothetical protein AABZ74_14605 [Cyanobacteriota bacterium]